MRNRLWIAVLLAIWIVNWMIAIPEVMAAPGAPEWIMALPAEHLTEWVVYHARRRALWPPPVARSRRRRKRRSRPSFRCPRVLTVEEEEQHAGSDKTARGNSDAVFDTQRWGLSPELSRALPERLKQFWQRYYECFRTKTRNKGEYAYHYLSGLLRLETDRNYTNIGQAAGVSGENIQHFMSNSPWSARAVLDQVQEEIKATPSLQEGGMLLLDESADEAAGNHKAGAGRQYNGRLGKVDMSQVGVFAAYVNLTDVRRPVWTWVDGELYLQEHWLSPEMTKMRKRVGISKERKFETKIELGLKMILRTQANRLPFEAVGCDDLYGRSAWFRDSLDAADLIYMADAPRNTQVYLKKPALGVPEPKSGCRGRKPTRLRILNGVKALKVHQVARDPKTVWKRVRVRSIERGELNDPFAALRVWTLREGEAEPVEEWLLIRREAKNRYNYALSNAPADASLERLAWLKCQRYFVERANQDAKSEAGWDELQARKYRGWEHHLALVVLAIWFVAQTKWEWGPQYARDPVLFQQFEVKVLPALSMANIRLLLRAAMPLPQPTPEEATAQVVEHLVNRTRSRKSRLKRQRATHHANAPP